jgi:cytochrome c oxidase cbb3-type subunit 3
MLKYLNMMPALAKSLVILLFSALARIAEAAEPALLTQILPGRSLEQATEVLKQSILAHNYTFVRQQAIDSRLVPVEWEAKSVRIVYFCNFDMMDAALRRNNLTTQIMPCRITLIEGDKGVALVAVNPAWISEQWNAPDLQPGCLQLKADYLAILEEAAL